MKYYYINYVGFCIDQSNIMISIEKSRENFIKVKIRQDPDPGIFFESRIRFNSTRNRNPAFSYTYGVECTLYITHGKSSPTSNHQNYLLHIMVQIQFLLQNIYLTDTFINIKLLFGKFCEKNVSALFILIWYLFALISDTD